ncbi:MAG: DUF6364 family protein [Bacteroidota bacterium]
MKTKKDFTETNKLTLSVNKHLVEKAKKYTALENESISNIVSDFLETYIAMKSNSPSSDNRFSTHAAKFAGIVSLKNSASKKSEIADIIIEKHQKRFK